MYFVTDYIYNFRIVIILNNYNILHFIDRCRCARSKDEGVGRVCGMGGEGDGDKEDRRAGIKRGWKLI